MTAPVPSPDPPGRAVLRIAGALTQLACASCLLLGTIAFVLVQQNNSGGVEYVVGWAVGALVGLVFGGLMTRGGLISLAGGAIIDLVLGVVLLAIEYDTVRSFLRVLPGSDVELIADAMTGIGVAMLVVFAMGLASIPQALRYTRWMHAETEPRLAGSTARGFPPPPVAAARGSVWQLPRVAPEENRSRRRMYFALAGFAIGFGAGIGVLVSSTQKPSRDGTVEVQAGSQVGSDATDTTKPGSTAPVHPDDAGVEDPRSDAGSGRSMAPALDAARPEPVTTLVQAQRVALANGDLHALGALLASDAFGFGVDSDDVAEGRAAVEAQLRKNLGELPAAGVNVESKFLAIGDPVASHAWIAMELEVSAPDQPIRRFAITQLAAMVGDRWTVVAWHWAVPVANATAERMAILGTLPAPKPIADKIDAPAEVAAAVRAAFASRRAFVEARSEHPSGFNFGSAPNERIIGGAAVKRVFDKLRAEIRVQGGMRIVGGGAWDRSQQASPTVAFAAANVDYTAKTRAATNLTQTFRVLAVFVKEGADWRIVQTQWSHGGPIR